ncbi:MAG: HigA family addiction module antidote protein [Ardenticatenaceae bacterium]|nr:HigA family addiction module antidote protein [Ardenticatenaceae bacterium]MCB8974750.1 HigA family addiction module antidote protein [Ardenticatenaceae bacterium]
MEENRIPPVHPGEILLEDFLEPLGISQYRLAKEMNVYPRKINEIVHGKRSITADTALRLSRFFGTTAELWMNLQALYDLEKARDMLEEQVVEEVTPFVWDTANAAMA